MSQENNLRTVPSSYTATQPAGEEIAMTHSEQSAADTETVDYEKLEELEMLLGDNYADLINTFVSNSTRTLEAMQQIILAGDADEIATLAHSLKGTSGNMGATQLYRYAIQMEKLAKAKDLAVMPELLSEINAALNAFKIIMSQKAS